MAPTQSEHWLQRYANDYHAWKLSNTDSRKSFTRPLGLVEYTFDTDGTEFGGRADMNTILALEISHTLPSKEDFRRRIALAWASLRLQHVLLMSRTCEGQDTGNRHFVIDLQDSAEVLESAKKSIIWVEDLYSEVDTNELLRHCLNVGRILKPNKCLSKLLVLPLVRLPNGNYELKFLIVVAHQISDGVCTHNWFSHFVRILNMSEPDVHIAIETFRTEEEVRKKLPPAQEDLYPKVSGSRARQRWFWAIVRVLRHKRRTLSPTFVNPLRRLERPNKAASFPPVFSKLFDYSEQSKPPMNSGHVTTALSPFASQRMIDLCRSIKVSIGAGCFALAGLSMMQVHEARCTDTPDEERLPFTASFPLNPRAFFGLTTPADSCMLAFSDGIVMPFLPSSLPVEGRFKVIARHANRELKMYQKRGTDGEVLSSHSPGRLLANAYLALIERLESKLPPHRQTGVNPQGSLPARLGQFGATCGVSSVGSRAPFFKPGTYDLNEVGNMEGKDFAADFRDLTTGVRARDNEFLVGSSTDAAGVVQFSVSYDLNAISEEAAEKWAKTVAMLLENRELAKL